MFIEYNDIMKRYEFHTHTTLSDGDLLPSELARRAAAKGLSFLAITDHVGWENYELIVSSVLRLVERGGYGIELLCGVEITHVPPEQIAELSRCIKALGNVLVVVHGESPVEPVAIGTNRAAVECAGSVDILAHPGFITLEEARIAAKNGIMLEITSRGGHNMTNGHVLKTALEAGSKLLVNSDAHEPADLLDAIRAERVLRGAGAGESLIQTVLRDNPVEMLARFGIRG